MITEINDVEVIMQMLQEVFEKTLNQAKQVIYNCSFSSGGLQKLLDSLRDHPPKGIKLSMIYHRKDGKLQVDVEKNEREFKA